MRSTVVRELLRYGVIILYDMKSLSPDSEAIAGYLENFYYDPARTDEVLSRYIELSEQNDK